MWRGYSTRPHVKSFRVGLLHNQHQIRHGLAAFLDLCETAEMKSLVTEAAADNRAIPNPALQLNDLFVRLRNQFLDRQLSALMQRANQPQTSDSERLELLHQQQELRRQKRLPLTPRA